MSPETECANEQLNDESNSKKGLIMVVLTLLLFVGFLIEGGTTMIATLSMHLASHIIIEFVRRAEHRIMYSGLCIY